MSSDPFDAQSPAMRAGDHIVTAGEPGETMFVVLSGRTGIRAEDGTVPVVFGVGEFFGEMSVIDARPRSATIVALDDGTRVIQIDRARFLYLISQQPTFALGVMSTLSRRMRGGAPAAERSPEPLAPTFTAAEIKPGLWQFRSNGRSCNTYLIVGRERTVLVDTGLASFYPALEEALRGIGHPVETVDFVLLTHEHADHVGAVPRLPGAPMIAAHPLAANKLALQDAFATVSGIIGESLGPIDVDCSLTEGSIVHVAPYRFEVIHTPGHTSGCICLADHDQDILISGDTLMAGGAMGGIFGSGNISDYIFSLRRLKRWGLNTVLPGHGRMSTTGSADVVTAIARSETLLRDTRELFAAVGQNDGFDRILVSLRALGR